MNRKDAILHAAIALFAKKGYNATSTSAVAKKAGVAEGLIFHHFKNKRSIFITIFEKMVNEYTCGIEQILNSDNSGINDLENIICFHFNFSKKKSKEFLLLMRDVPTELLQSKSSQRQLVIDNIENILDLYKKCIKKGQQDGSIRKISCQKTALIIYGMLHGIGRLKVQGILYIPDMSQEIIKFCRLSFAEN